MASPFLTLVTRWRYSTHSSVLNWLLLAIASAFSGLWWTYVQAPLLARIAQLEQPLPIPRKFTNQQPASATHQQMRIDIPRLSSAPDAMNDIEKMAAQMKFGSNKLNYKWRTTPDLDIAALEVGATLEGDDVQVRQWLIRIKQRYPAMSIDTLSLQRTEGTNSSTHSELKLSLYFAK